MGAYFCVIRGRRIAALFEISGKVLVLVRIERGRDAEAREQIDRGKLVGI